MGLRSSRGSTCGASGGVGDRKAIGFAGGNWLSILPMTEKSPSIATARVPEPGPRLTLSRFTQTMCGLSVDSKW